MEFDFRHKELYNIIEVYREVMFGKNYRKECPADIQMDVMKYVGNGKRLITVKVDFKAVSKEISPLKFRTVFEKYSLDVDEKGNIVIKADYYPGVVRALDSLSQLVEKNENVEDGQEYRIKYTPIKISDEPDYPYRGLMLDTSREYFYPGAIKQMLDGMMLGRINVFHWHFMDSDSMAMKLESFPNITDYTAFRKNEIYSPEDVKEIVNYAKIRGIKVIPEIETPARVNALGNYTPLKNIVKCFTDLSQSREKYSTISNAVLDIGAPGSIDFAEKTIKDIIDMFEPEVVHLGGEHPNMHCLSHLDNPLNSLKKFINQSRSYLKSQSPHARVMYWYQKEVSKYNPEDILQIVGSSRDVQEAINSNGENDFIISGGDDLRVDKGYPDFKGTHSGVGRTMPWRKYWDFNPQNYDRNGKMLGSEVLVWTEMMNEFEFLPKLFPRAAIVAMKHWNANAPRSGGAVIETMMRFQYRLKSYGVPTEKISMRYCEEHTHHCFGI